ncbi:MAG TPA: hypothetical protein VK644_15570 [Chitinophagaceae bacterium]|nr:hypothetical protein [Chitinophagaceae bacterium]
MANRPIPVAVATGMISEYLSYMKAESIGKQSQYVGFNSPELLKWLEMVSPYMDELRICFGIYPPGHESAGLITTILWPYKNGAPAKKSTGSEGKGDGGGGDLEPYNEGQTGP